jgi:hypothetical protein
MFKFGSSFAKKIIKIQNGRKVQYMADFFCTKIHDFLVALNELF